MGNGILDGLMGGLKNAFSSSTDGTFLGMDKDMSGILGTALMGLGGGNPAGFMQPFMLMKMLNGEGSATSSPSGLPGNPNVPDVSKADINLQAPVSPLPSNKQELLKQLQVSAQAAYPDNPMMQQVAITQAIHESGLMGKPSQLARQHNNYFGIKAPGTAGTVNMRTGEVLNGAPTTVMAGFGRNNSMGDSFMQHQRLMGNKRYAPVLGASDPNAAFTALQSAGYATDPRYAQKLANTYNQYVAPLYR
jgi:flagellum-specific peptidoglycan hydrolase FlgJ